jgi:DNA (cytosine-5)-methyltransferase 1
MTRVVDLFCGIGGLTNGLFQAGLNVVAGIDIDNNCRFAFETNNNSKFISKSITDVSGAELLELFGNEDIKILVGCAPCQPFSNHQKKKNDRGTHKDWGLLYDFLRLINETKPEIISMENVPTLIKEKVFSDFVSELELQGYFVNYRIINTQNYGMAQRRNRLILLASKFGRLDFIDDKTKGKTVKEVIGHLRPIVAGSADLFDRYHVCCSLSELNLQRIKSSKQGGTWQDWPVELLPECYKKKTGLTYKSVYGRMDYNKVAPTLTTQFHSYGTGRFGHPTQNRAISIREGALLQSFPENYIFVESNKRVNIKSLSKQIGNAVPPRLGLFIGKCILEHIKLVNGI